MVADVEAYNPQLYKSAIRQAYLVRTNYYYAAKAATLQYAHSKGDRPLESIFVCTFIFTSFCIKGGEKKKKTDPTITRRFGARVRYREPSERCAQH